MIKFSVIIPTYNRKKLLEKSLESLFRQSYPQENFEILVCDDGSTDTTSSLVKKLQRNHPNLRYLRQSHGGPSKTINLGIKNARGEIIVFTDDDCLSNPSWLKNIARTFATNPTIVGVEGKTVTVPQKVTPLTSQIINLEGGTYQTCNVAYKRRVMGKIGGSDEKFTFPHCYDVDLALRVLKLGPIIFEAKAIVVHPPRPTTFKGELARVGRIPAEFYLFLKHPDYFEEKYGKTNIFFQVVFVNSIWIRLFHLKFYFNWIRKNPLIYLEFFLRTVLEIALIIILAPKFWLSFKRIKREFGTV